MDPVPAPRLRPRVRGAFDEETCRMRLHEIGDEVVPRFPFAYGIQGIYETLLGEYGTSQIADAISVFHELLEDESYEGNIWRSWRHEWRHRNDDILNPFVPAVGDFVLPPPTNKCIRTLRGANFSAAEDEEEEEEEEEEIPAIRRSRPDHDENRPSYVSCHSQSHSLGRDRSLSTGSIVKREPFEEVRQPETQLDIAASEQSQNRTSDRFSSAWHQEMDDGSQELLPDRAYLDQMPRLSLSAVKSYTVEETAPPIHTVSDHASLHSWCADELDGTKANHHETGIVSGEVLSIAPRELASPTPGRFPIGSPGEEEISQIRSHKCRPSDHKGGVTCSRISTERYPIDGHDEGSLSGHRRSVLDGRKGTQPNQLIRTGRSVLQHMPKIFRKDRESQQTNQEIHHLREDGSSSTSILFRRKSRKAGWCSSSKAANDSPPEFGPNRTLPAYAFDGACDEDDTSPTMPAVDVNKALPPQPLLTKNKTRASCRADTPSLTLSHESRARPSTASTASSDLSRVSSKKRFHRTAHELVRPDMAGSRDPSPLRQLDSDKFLVASKHDPLASPKLPDTPMTFSSFNNANPFMDLYDEFVPPMPVLAIPELKSPDPVKMSRGQGIPQSRSEGQICSPRTLPGRYNESCNQLVQSYGTNEHGTTHARGRVPSRDIPQAMGTLPGANEKPAVHLTESRKRSRSPVKRFLGLGKSQSMKEIPQEKEPTDENEKKAGLKLWGDRLRHGFLTNTESKANINSPQPEISRANQASKSTFPISISPLRQARIHCEVELMICTSANKFLKAQKKAGVMSADSVSKIVTQWAHKGRPQVLEFQFDQATQRDLILYNINTFKFHGEARANPMVLNATMYAWKVMAKEMSVRTFCTPDSVLRKHMHDAHRVLEMLGAGLSTFLALQELQVSALKEMADAQKKRLERQK